MGLHSFDELIESATMTGSSMTLPALLEKGTNANFLDKIATFVAQRLTKRATVPWTARHEARELRRLRRPQGDDSRGPEGDLATLPCTLHAQPAGARDEGPLKRAHINEVVYLPQQSLPTAFEIRLGRARFGRNGWLYFRPWLPSTHSRAGSQKSTTQLRLVLAREMRQFQRRRSMGACWIRPAGC